MKKILLTLLAVLMFATAGTANVLADEAPKYDAYISFGDSITRGLGSEGTDSNTWSAEATDSNIRIVKGAYNAIVGADIIGIDAKDQKQKYYVNKTTGKAQPSTNYFPVAGYGLTVKDALDLISKEPTGSAKDFRGIEVNELYGKEGSEGHIRTTIAEADEPLITVNLGLMDVTLYSSADETFKTNVSKLLESGFDQSKLPNLIAEYEKAMFKAYLEWAVDYDKLIGQIVNLRAVKYPFTEKSYNDTTIVLVGFFNPLRGVNYEISLGEDKGSVYLPLGNILDPIIGLMNETSRFIAKKYDKVSNIDVVYADVSNGEGYAIANETTINEIGDIADGDGWSLYIHGTADTYAYMARQIENAINGTTYTGGYADIAVDLVRFSENDLDFSDYIYAEGLPAGKLPPEKTIKITALLDGKEVDPLDLSVNDTILIVNSHEETDHKLLQVFVTTYGTADTKKQLYTQVDPRDYAIIDDAKFRKAQKDGKVVRVGSAYNPNIIHNPTNNKIIAQGYKEGSTWCYASPVTDTEGNVIGATPIQPAVDNTIDFKLVDDTLNDFVVFDNDTFAADQEAGKIAKLNSDGTLDLEFSTEELTIDSNRHPVAKDYNKDNSDVWVKTVATKDGYGNILEVKPVTITEETVDNETVESVAVQTYVLIWRGDHYEAYNIDSTNDVKARVERVLSPITAPIKAKVAAVEKWYNDWYSHTDLGRFTIAVDTYKASYEAIADADKAITAAKDAVTAAEENELFAKQAMEVAMKTPAWNYTENVEEAIAAYKDAKDATKAAKDAVKDAYVGAYEARKTVVEDAGVVAEKGTTLVKSTSKWAYDYITHLGN